MGCLPARDGTAEGVGTGVKGGKGRTKRKTRYKASVKRQGQRVLGEIGSRLKEGTRRGKNASEPRYGLTGAPVLQRRCTSRISERPDSSWDIQRTEYPDRLYDFPFCHGSPSPPPSSAVSTFSLFSASFVPFRFYFFLHIFLILSLHLWHIDGIRYNRNFTWEFLSWHFGWDWIRKRNWFVYLSEEENEWPRFDFLVTAIDRPVIEPT